VSEWPALAALFLIAAMIGGLLWSVWRHRVVEDLHAIRGLLEERQRWEREIAEGVRILVHELHEE